jgi:hypothetical protein
MSEQTEMKAYKRGRAPFEVRSFPWPVVTRALLTRAMELGEIDETRENPLVGALVRGWVMLHNTTLWTRKAMAEATKRGDTALVERLTSELERLQQVREEWPMVVVG